MTATSIRVDTVQWRSLVDLLTFLILGVAVLIVVSGYLLFNDVPRLGDLGSRRRR